MDSQTGTILSTLLKKRLKTLGYPSLRKFHADRPGLGLSYEVLRQVVYSGHIPRPETLFRILGSMQFSSSQVRKICGMHYGDYLPIPSATSGRLPSGFRAAGRREPGISGGSGRGGRTPPRDPGRKTNRLPHRRRNRERSFPPSRLPSENPVFRQRGYLGDGRGAGANRGAEGSPERRSPGGAAAPVRRGTRGDLPVPRPEEPDPPVSLPRRKSHVRFRRRDRLPGPLPWRPAGLRGRRGPRRRHAGAYLQGRPGTVRELDALPVIASARRAAAPQTSLLLSVARSLLPDGILDPERTADAIARAGRRDDPPGLLGFARNLLERGSPGTRQGKTPRKACPRYMSSPLRCFVPGTSGGSTRDGKPRLPDAHPPDGHRGGNRPGMRGRETLHTPASMLDVISFPRALSPVVAGIEPERGTRPRIGRSATTVGRKPGRSPLSSFGALPFRRCRRLSGTERRHTRGSLLSWLFPSLAGRFRRGGHARGPPRRGCARRRRDGGCAVRRVHGESGIPERFLAHLPGGGSSGKRRRGCSRWRDARGRTYVSAARFPSR